MGTGDGLPTIPFASSAAWELWLQDNHAASEGVWIRIAKKDVTSRASATRRCSRARSASDGSTGETRARRLAKFVAMLEAGETIYPRLRDEARSASAGLARTWRSDSARVSTPS